MMNKLMMIVALTLSASCSTYAPFQATDNPTGPKSGEACAKYVFGINSSGEEGIAEAAMKGNVKRIATVDKKAYGFYPFVWTRCTVVTGN